MLVLPNGLSPQQQADISEAMVIGMYCAVRAGLMTVTDDDDDDDGGYDLTDEGLAAVRRAACADGKDPEALSELDSSWLPPPHRWSP